ncbi:dihydroorotate dehydrogenase (NAD+) catalytic subunit [Natronincola peptidivorans]|uniref:Dihydroorotate dehydrogenase n=1 Tax=Natronincola peptidivorans TaxID=426128 RepID=A0A1I0BNC6_9FIRM|nr:dihydroorotate dehydrogenase [Natronincola peptidivorans]SET08512.1 dihydroorotate dehydrogenase (NAD+) catalytic subunit [Natronincola peptidivorans]
MMRPSLKVNIGGIELENPIMTASGTFGSGKEYGDFVDLNRLGAVVVKGVSSVAWKGNPTPRVAETHGGMLNSVGLQNPGVEEFIKKDIPFLRGYDTKIIVNIAGKTVEEYCAVAERLSKEDVDMIELNISCPNVKEGGVSFGTNRDMAEYVTREVKKYTKQPLIVKLSPNVTDIVEIAKAAVDGGADALSLINTLTGMAIDIHKRKPILANVVGGLSGPAIKPVAVRMVYQVAQAVKVPIIGMGGIMTGEDAVEFMLAGATAVAVGTANFMNPTATTDILEGIEKYMSQYKIKDIKEIQGSLMI